MNTRMNTAHRTLLAAGIFVCTFALAGAAPNTLTRKEKSAGWMLLFDGRSLENWKVGEQPEAFRVDNGEIVVTGPRSHLYYNGSAHNHDFRNFELKLDVKTWLGANSGVYIHTQYQDTGWPAKGYEIQVNNSHKDPSRTAGLWGVQDNMEVPAKDGEWFTLRIRVQGKHLETWVNDKPVANYIEEPNPPRSEDMKGRLLGSGTVALQGHHVGNEVHYRNIKLRVLP